MQIDTHFFGTIEADDLVILPQFPMDAQFQCLLCGRLETYGHSCRPQRFLLPGRGSGYVHGMCAEAILKAQTPS